MKTTQISDNVQKAYDDQYTDTDRITTWRELGAKQKAKNILDLVGNRSFKKVLEFGAGEGSILKFLNESSQFEELYALEISDSGIKQIKNRQLSKLKEVKKFNGYVTDYADEEFDLVYCSHVIEHVEHPRLVLREIQRISKYQIFEVPLDYSKKVDKQVEHLLGYGHINIFTPSLFKFLLKSEGFQIEKDILLPISQTVLEFNWYNNMNLEKTLKRRLNAYFIANKHKLVKIILGKAIADEHSYNTYTCFTNKSGGLKIF